WDARQEIHILRLLLALCNTHAGEHAARDSWVDAVARGVADIGAGGWLHATEAGCTSWTAAGCHSVGLCHSGLEETLGIGWKLITGLVKARALLQKLAKERYVLGIRHEGFD